MWSKLAVIVCILVSVAESKYFETFFVEPEPYAEEVPSRNALRIKDFKWPRAEVPFVFDESSYGTIYCIVLLGFYSIKKHRSLLDIEDEQRVLNAMTLITSQTCVRFVAKNESHLEHIMFFKVTICG